MLMTNAGENEQLKSAKLVNFKTELKDLEESVRRLKSRELRKWCLVLSLEFEVVDCLEDQNIGLSVWSDFEKFCVTSIQVQEIIELKDAEDGGRELM